MPEKLNVLYFCPSQLWPTNTGARLRNLHLANALASGCSVTLLQIAPPGEAKINPPPSSTFAQVISVEKERSYTPAKVLRGLIGPVPVTVLNYYSSAIAAKLRRILSDGNFQAVQLESIHLLGYLPDIQSATSRPRVLLDWHNVESELMRRYADVTSNPAKRFVAKRTAALLHAMESEALKKCDAHTIVSQREKQKLVARAPAAKIHVIPNGVDTRGYPQVSSRPANNRTTLLFVGSMDYHANEEAVVWFVRHVWPKLAKDSPTLEFTIVGRNPSPAVRALQSDRVKVTGTVDDVRPYYEGAFAMVVPLRVGGGTRLKIFEAMSSGVPVISTTLGAEGIDAIDRQHILLADGEEAMQTAVKELLRDDHFRRHLIQEARKLVVERYDWQAVAGQLLSVHARLQSGSA